MNLKDVMLSERSPSRVGTVGEGEGRTEWEGDMSPPPSVNYKAGGKRLHGTGSSAQCSAMTEKGGVGWEGGGLKKGGSMYI